MPRDGSNVYTQPFPNVVDGTTIESAVYNGFTNDVALDLNTPRPVVAGGTGANNAADAAANLGVVTGKAAMTYTEAEKTQARANVYAAPLDALAYNGMQVNGGMNISQEVAFGVSQSTDGFVLDGWRLLKTGSVVPAASAGVTPGFPGLTHLLNLGITTAQTTMGAGDYVFFAQIIEGYRTARLAWGTANAQPITIGFWSSHVRTGVYSVALSNGGSTRTCVASYTHNASNVAQYNVVNFPGDTAGIWATDNTVGMQVAFVMAAGSTLTAPAANTWYGANYIAAPGQVNGVAATSDAMRISGVVVLPGTEAPSAARSALIMRPYDQELVTCQRYWQYLPSGGPILFSSTTTALAGVSLPVRMRAEPTVTTPAIANAFTSNVGYVNLTSLSSNNMFTQDGMVTFNCSTTTATGVGFLYPPTTTKMIKLDARL